MPSRFDGKIYGVPYAQSQTGFFYNKELMAKAGVDGAKIKTWDDLLDAVKKLKAAGVTPLMVGGADKWPIHFYWTNLAVRIGGKPAFEAALRGENGGFEGETFLKSGQLFKQLVDLQPFQNGFLGFKNPQAVGAFGDGKAAMTLAHQHRLSHSSARFPPTRRASATTTSAGSISRRCPAARANRPTRWAASTAGSSPRARRRKRSSS